MATTPTNSLTYLPLGQALPPSSATAQTTRTRTPASQPRVGTAPPMMGMPLDAKGGLGATANAMNAGMQAIFGGGKGPAVRGGNMTGGGFGGGGGGTGGGAGNGLTYTPNGGAGGLNYTPATPAAPSTTPTTTPTTTPASQNTPSWMAPGSFGQGMQQFFGSLRPQGTGNTSTGGDMFQSGASAPKTGTPKWKQLISAALSR